jgi:hypothetical protein
MAFPYGSRTESSSDVARPLDAGSVPGMTETKFVNESWLGFFEQFAGFR